MKKNLFIASILAVTIAASCSKGGSDATTSVTTSAKFSIEFPATYLSIDSVRGTYTDADGKSVSVKLGNVTKWESPSISYAKGKTAYAQISAYGKTLAGDAFSKPLLQLINTKDNTIISAKGTTSISGSIYTFNAEMSNAF